MVSRTYFGIRPARSRRPDEKKKEEDVRDPVHDTADATTEKMLKDHPKSFEAHLWAAQYYRDAVTPPKLDHYRDLSAKNVDAAYALAPDQLPVILATAGAFRTELVATTSHKAREELQRGAELHRGCCQGAHPKDWPVYQALAKLEMSDRKCRRGSGWPFFAKD